MEFIDDFEILSAGAVRNFLYGIGAQVEIRIIKMDVVNTFLWLSQQTSTVFILGVFMVKCVDHCIVVNMSEKIKIDRAEEKRLKFCIDMLKNFGILDVEELRIGEVH